MTTGMGRRAAAEGRVGCAWCVQRCDGFTVSMDAHRLCLPTSPCLLRSAIPARSLAVQVFFEPPVLSLPGGVHIRIGPPSSVVLKTTFVDERVRLGLGSRGSYFVFTRGGAADAAGGCPRPGCVVCTACLIWLWGTWVHLRARPKLAAAMLCQCLQGVCVSPSQRTPPHAGMDQVGLEQCSTAGKVVLFGIVGALMVSAQQCAHRSCSQHWPS